MSTSARTAAGMVLLACALSACSADEPDVDVTGDWAFVSGTTPDGPLDPPARELPTLAFDDAGGSGHTGCNGYGGDVEHDGADLSFGPISQSLVGCDGAVGAFETDYLAALGVVEHAAREGDELVLSGEDVTLRFAPVPPWPAAAVLDRTWQLHALTDDGGADREPAGHRDGGDADPASLYLSEHRITATTGCRSLRGRWAELNGVLVLTEATYAGDCGPEPSAQELQVTHVLQRFTAEVALRSGQHELVLTSAVADADGTRQQLVYRR